MIVLVNHAFLGLTSTLLFELHVKTSFHVLVQLLEVVFLLEHQLLLELLSLLLVLSDLFINFTFMLASRLLFNGDSGDPIEQAFNSVFSGRSFLLTFHVLGLYARLIIVEGTHVIEFLFLLAFVITLDIFLVLGKHFLFLLPLLVKLLFLSLSFHLHLHV